MTMIQRIGNLNREIETVFKKLCNKRNEKALNNQLNPGVEYGKCR